MELKLSGSCGLNQSPKLLIVPYGIETRLVYFRILRYGSLLIVPYGIETGL